MGGQWLTVDIGQRRSRYLLSGGIHPRHPGLGSRACCEYNALGITTESYGNTNTEKGSFVAAFCGMLTVVSTYYPDRPSAPRTFPGGLEAELGGPKTVTARKSEE